MKKIICGLLAVIVAFGLVLGGCSKKSGNFLKDCYVDFSALDYIGVANVPANSASSNSAAMSAYAADNTTYNYLVGLKDGEIKDIVFHRNSKDSEKIVKQSESDYNLERLFITDEFIFMKYTSKSGRSEYEYLDTGFNYTPRAQSYVVHKPSGKIFAVEDIVKPYETNNSAIGLEQVFQDGVVKIKGAFYKMSFEDEQLVLRDFIENSNVNIYQIDIDKNGIIFVGNDSISQKDGNYYYYQRQQVSTNMYALGSDGRMYFLKFWSADNRIQYYNDDLQLTDIGQSSSVFMTTRNSSYVKVDICVENDIVYEISSNGISIYRIQADGTLSSIGIKTILNATFYNGVLYGISGDDFSLCKYTVENTAGEYSIKTENLLYDNQKFIISSLISAGDSMIASKEKISSTEQYFVGVSNNKITIDLIGTQNYNSRGILSWIKPIN